MECRGDCAEEHGRRQQGLTSTKEYRVDSAEEAGRRDLFCSKTQRVGSTPKRAKGSSSRESFHAAT